MAKSSGLGDRLFIGGYDLSGDSNTVATAGGNTPLVVTGVDKSAFERIGGRRDGSLSWTSYFNTSLNQAHPVLSALPTADVTALYCRGTAIGGDAAAVVGKQPDYAGTRGNDGAFTFAVQIQGNGTALEWGQLLTAGLRTDTAATNGASYDQGAATTFGAQAYLQVSALTGTDFTVKIQDSADNSSFTDVTGLTFTQTTTARTTQRIATASGATIRRYLRAVTVTTGGFTSATFVVVVNINPVAVSF